MAHPVVHFEIGCRDREKTGAFYRELFGWETQDPGGPALMIDTKSDTGIQGHITALGHEPHNYVNFYVQCERLEPVVEEAEALGASVLVPPTDVPGMGRFCWLADVEGTQFGLWESAGG